MLSKEESAPSKSENGRPFQRLKIIINSTSLNQSPGYHKLIPVSVNGVADGYIPKIGRRPRQAPAQPRDLKLWPWKRQAVARQVGSASTTERKWKGIKPQGNHQSCGQEPLVTSSRLREPVSRVVFFGSSKCCWHLIFSPVIVFICCWLSFITEHVSRK